MSDNLRFLKRFLSDPIATGAIAPSSRHLARTMVQDMGLSFDRVETSHVVWRNVPPAFVYRCTR